MSEQQDQRLKVQTLEESILVLKMYQKVKKYSVVAKSLGIEKKTVKNIIENSNEIKKRNVQQKYNKIKKNIKSSDFTQHTYKVYKTTENHLQSIAKDKKYELLEDCVYETLKRKKQVIDMELITTTALDFRNIMELKDFEVNKRWLNLFKYKYKIQFSNQVPVPPESVDLHDVLEYCKLKHLQNINKEFKNYKTKKSSHHQSDNKCKSSLTISNCKDAVLALKPIEEYAVLNYNYDAVICVNKLKNHLKIINARNEKDIYR